MFYANFILKKRGPLSRIWLAAHWDKKLTKAHIFETDIEGSVTAILAPEMKLALRTSSHLLLGVVRIYSRKAKYLLADCSEALVKIKLAFRPGMVDLPNENREASLAAINIREDFTSFDLDVADFSDIDFHARFSVNQSRPEDITLHEDIACVEFVGDDGFDDSDNLGGPLAIETVNLFLGADGNSNFKPLDDYFERVELLSRARTPQKMTRYSSLADSGFGSPSVWPDSLSPAFGEANGSGDFGFNPVIGTIPEVNLDDIMFEHNDVIRPEVEPSELLQEREKIGSEDKRNENGGQNQIGSGYDECYYDAGIGGGGDDDDNNDDDSLSNGVGEGAEDHTLFSEENVFNQEEPLLYEDPKGNTTTRAKASENIIEKNGFDNESRNVLDHCSKPVINEMTTLIENNAEVFALGPVEVNFKERRAKRKRRLIIDEYKVISSGTMKSHLSDSSELVIPLDLAPPTKKLMQWKESGGVEKLFILPGMVHVNAKLFSLFNRNLLTTPLGDLEDEDTVLEDNSVEGNGRPPELKRGRSEDANVELNQSLLSAYGVDNVAPAEADTSASIDCSSSLPFESTVRRTSRRLFGGGGSDDNDPCPEKNLPVLPDFGAAVDDGRASKADGSPAPRKLRKRLRDSGASDSDDGAENEDAIFDVEPAQTCSERANLRQELEETELEEILWGRRSTQMQHILRRKLDASDTVRFGQLTARNNRKQVASKFYTILVLTKAQSIGVAQRQPYGDIEISKGPAFGSIV